MSSAALRREAPAPVASPVRHDADVVRLPDANWRHPGDMHLGIYGVALGCWVTFLALFWITFSVSGNALFMLTVCTFYAFMFFSVPVVLTRLMPDKRPSRGSLLRFLRGKFETIDGPISGFEALVQVILVPACLIVGGTAIGFIIHAARTAH